MPASGMLLYPLKPYSMEYLYCHASRAWPLRGPCWRGILFSLLMLPPCYLFVHKYFVVLRQNCFKNSTLLCLSSFLQVDIVKYVFKGVNRNTNYSFCYWILKFTINLSLKFLWKSLVVGNVPFLYSNCLCLCCYALVRYHETMSFVKRELIWPQDGASCPTLRYRIAASC